MTQRCHSNRYRGRVPTLQPVIGRVAAHVMPFDLWPVAQPDTGWLRLHEAVTSAEVGMAVWSLLFHTAPIGDDIPVPPTPVEAVRLLVEADTLYGAGGLLLTDTTTRVAVEPGCCCDLFEWRDWLAVLDRRPIDLGHNPSPEVEYRGDLVRVWTDSGDDGNPPASRAYVDLDSTSVPALLRSAQRDLAGFLAAADTWANSIAPTHASRFITALDAGLQISAPLPS